MKAWKYKIIEYEFIKLGYEESKVIEKTVKSVHKTNSWLLYQFIKICLKINGIYFEVRK